MTEKEIMTTAKEHAQLTTKNIEGRGYQIAYLEALKAEYARLKAKHAKKD